VRAREDAAQAGVGPRRSLAHGCRIRREDGQRGGRRDGDGGPRGTQEVRLPPAAATQHQREEVSALGRAVRRLQSPANSPGRQQDGGTILFHDTKLLASVGLRIRHTRLLFA
jgi:hypothetical protein